MSKVLREWRLCEAQAGGVLVWFDPMLEAVELRDLTFEEKALILDSVSSVSAPVEVEESCEQDDLFE